MKREIIGQGAVVVLAVAIVVAIVGGAIGYVLAPTAEVPSDIAELQAQVNELQSTVSNLEAELAAIPPKPGEGLRFDFIGAGTAEDPAWAIVKRGVDDAAAVLGVNAIMHFGAGSTPEYLADLDKVIAAETDGIGGWFYDPAFAAGMQKCIDLGIPVIQLGNKDPEWAAKGVLSVSYGSLYDTGLLLGEWLSQYIEDGDHILISAEVPGLAYSEGRRQGILDALDGAGITYTYDYLDAHYEIATCETRITSYMIAHPELDVAVGVGGITTERTAVSAQALDYGPGDILIAGWDPLPETVAGIKSGYVKGIALDPRYLEGYYGVMELYTLVIGLPATDHLLSELIVDISNVELLDKPWLKM